MYFPSHKTFANCIVYIHVCWLAVFFFAFIGALLSLLVRYRHQSAHIHTQTKQGPTSKTLLYSTTRGKKLYGVPLTAVTQEIQLIPPEVFKHKCFKHSNRVKPSQICLHPPECSTHTFSTYIHTDVTGTTPLCTSHLNASEC